MSFDDGWMDPPFKANLIKHCTAHPGVPNRQLILIVLTDWWKSRGPRRNGTVDGNVDYFERCFTGEYRGDLTYRLMFDNRPHPRYGILKGWVREVVGQGMRRSDSAVGDLTAVEHHLGMNKWWLPLALELKPVKVFLCGEWAITPPGLPEAPDSPQVIAKSKLGPNTEFVLLPHPRAWVKTYE